MGEIEWLLIAALALIIFVAADAIRSRAGQTVLAAGAVLLLLYMLSMFRVGG